MASVYAIALVTVGAVLGGIISPDDESSASADNESKSFSKSLVGYSTYVLIESYGSLLVCIFWSFTNDEVDLESAESSYGYIVAVGQLGAISGSALVEFWIDKEGRSFGWIVGNGGFWGGVVTCIIVFIYGRVYFSDDAVVVEEVTVSSECPRYKDDVNGEGEEDNVELVDLKGTDKWFSPSPTAHRRPPGTASKQKHDEDVAGSFTDGIYVIIQNPYVASEP